MGPVVWSSRYDTWLFAGYEVVKAALNDFETFCSGEGVGLFPPAIEALAGTVIASDPPEHTALRKALSQRMSPVGLRGMQGEIEVAAERLIDKVIAAGSFDAVADLAQKFPLMIVVDLIGLPDECRSELLDWADAGFNTFGPGNERTIRSMPKMGEMFEFIGKIDADPAMLRSGSMGREIYEAAERGEIRSGQAGRLMAAFLMAGLDTTIASIANAVWLFGKNPDEWARIRQNPAIIPIAYNEILRIESPAQAFRRTATRDVEVAGVSIKSGDPVLLLYGSANRDESIWPDPERFDANRRGPSHLALGHGLHNCIGQGLARLEAHALLEAMSRKVQRIELGASTRHINNVIRSLASLEAKFIVA